MEGIYFVYVLLDQSDLDQQSVESLAGDYERIFVYFQAGGDGGWGDEVQGTDYPWVDGLDIESSKL